MLPNEMLSRQEMRRTPPHLLLTNYAMLEYLLLRPLDMDLFATGEDSKWRFIVVDEAHVYDGSQGAEIAMLLRRVRDRVAPKRSRSSASRPRPRWVATRSRCSHQVRDGNLFGQPFEWVARRRLPAGPDHGDAGRKPPPVPSGVHCGAAD